MLNKLENKNFESTEEKERLEFEFRNSIKSLEFENMKLKEQNMNSSQLLKMCEK